MISAIAAPRLLTQILFVYRYMGTRTISPQSHSRTVSYSMGCRSFLPHRRCETTVILACAFHIISNCWTDQSPKHTPRLAVCDLHGCNVAQLTPQGV